MRLWSRQRVGVSGQLDLSIAGPPVLFTPDFARESSRPRTRSALRAPGPPARFTPDLMRLSLRTSRAFHPRTSRALHPADLPRPSPRTSPRPSPRTSRAFHPGPPVHFTPDLPLFHSGPRRLPASSVASAGSQGSAEPARGGTDLECPSDVGDGLVELASLCECGAQVVVRIRQSWRQFDGAPEVSERVGDAILRQEKHAEVVVRLGEIRVDRKRPFEGARGLGRLSCGIEGVAEVERQPLIPRIERRGLAQVANSVARPAL